MGADDLCLTYGHERAEDDTGVVVCERCGEVLPFLRKRTPEEREARMRRMMEKYERGELITLEELQARLEQRREFRRSG